MVVQGVSFAELWKRHQKDVEGVVYGVLKWHRSNDSFKRLLAAAQVALWEASLTFEEEKAKGNSFWSFAKYRVRGAVLDELRVWDHLGRDARTKVRNENTESISWALLYPRGLTPIRGVAIADNPEENVAEKEKAERLRDLIDALPPRERFIATKLLIEQKTMAEVAEALDVTLSRICQIKGEIVAKLKASFKDGNE